MYRTKCYGSQENFWRYLALDPQTAESNTAFLHERLADHWGEGEFHCAIEHRALGHLIGTTRVSVLSNANRCGSLGYALNQKFTGQGYMTEAAQRILKAGFEHLGLHRIKATADVRDQASWRVMERIGMQREGLVRDHRLIRGQWCNSYLYAGLSSDRI